MKIGLDIEINSAFVAVPFVIFFAVTIIPKNKIKTFERLIKKFLKG